METPVHVFICAQFIREARAAIDKAASLSHLRLHPFPARCGAPPLNEDEVARCSNDLPPDEPAIWVGGACIAQMMNRCEPTGAATTNGRHTVYPLTQCFHLLADPEQVDEALRVGSYLCSPGWLLQWRQHLRALGLADPKLASALFAESVTRLLLLDTGSEHEPASVMLTELEAFAAHVGQPYTRQYVGLGYLRLQLSTIGARAALQQARTQTQQRVADAQRQAAEAAMAMDLLGELSTATNQQEVIHRILEVFQALFAPRQLCYLPLNSAAAVAAEAIGLGDQPPIKNEVLRQARAFAQDDALSADTESGEGFLLKLRDGEKVLGILVLEDFALPKYRLAYRNLALQMLGLCAMAMARAEALASLSRSEARYRSLFRAMHEGFVVHEVRPVANGEVEYCFVDANRAFERLAGVDRDALIGRCYGQVSPAVCEVYLEPCAKAAQSPHPVHFEAEWTSQAKVLDVYAYSPMPGFFAVILTDITLRREAEARVRHLAYHDPLTDLPNRALLDQRAQHALAQTAYQASSLALLFCDLDRFKAINDQLGHAAGDRLLKEVARRFRAAVRKTDTVSRLGGDEFVVLLPQAGQSEACAVADKLLTAMAEPMQIDDRWIQISLSIGISLCPEHGTEFGDLSRASDAALYAAKRDGRACARLYEAEIEKGSAPSQ